MSGSIVRSGAPRAAPVHASVDDGGFRLPASWSGVLDVAFDGQRVWSAASADQPTAYGGVRRFPWPEVLRPYLDGRARVTVREHGTNEVLADQEVAFGSGRGLVRVVDRNGRPLAVTKWGRMNHPFDAASSHAIDAYLDQVEKVLAVLHDDCGLPAFLSYGSLLGAVRDATFIGHDVDADLGYLSAHDQPVDVVRESFRVERALRARGWTVRRENGGFLALWFPQPDGGTRNLDVFTCFVVDGWLHQVHDVRARLPRSAVLPLGSVTLEGRAFPAPADPPALLEAAYGPGWRTPDPSFAFKTPRATARRVRGWLGGLRNHRDYWDDYWNRTRSAGGDGEEPTEPSMFAEWAHGREPEAVPFVDIGCGNGRDALWFARSGREVLGLDYAGAGIRAARAAARGESLPAAFEVCNLYDFRHVLAVGTRLASDDRPKVLYCHFLVEALEDRGRHDLWRLAAMALRGGGRLYLEFRGRHGSATNPARGEHIQRLLDPDTVADEIRSRRGRIQHREEGRDLTRSRNEKDPYVCRLIVMWK